MIVAPSWAFIKADGVKEEVFYFNSGGRCQNLKGRRPAMKRVVGRVYYRNTGGYWPGFARRDHFAVRWTGLMAIRRTGIYKFSLVSDDGSKLWLAGALVVNNDGVHGWRDRRGGKGLGAGLHHLRLEFFERTGAAGIMLRYQGKDTSNRLRVISAKVLKRTLLAKIPVKRTRKAKAGGLREEVFYFHQGSKCRSLFSVKPSMVRTIQVVHYPKTAYAWPGFRRGDHFAVRWTGSMIFRRRGAYRFSLVSDDGSKFWVGNRLVVNNDGLHGMRDRQAQRNFGFGKRNIRIEMFERGGHAGMIFRYKGPDTGNRMITVPATAMRKTAKGIAASGVLEEAFYFGQGGRCPNLLGRKPNKARAVRVINYRKTRGKFPGLARADNFAIRWKGFLYIKRSGTYRFSLISDDGSKLWIGNAFVVNNDGLHGMRNREGSRHLNGRPWRMRIEMFERGGEAGIAFRYRGRDTGNRMIPVRALTTRSKKANGLVEEAFYFRQGGACQNLKGRRASTQRVVKYVYYRNTGGTWPGFATNDNFAVRWRGSIFLSKLGNYRFSLISDDGSKLWLGGKFTINNDGLHGWRNRESGWKGMGRGIHGLRIEFFERGGHAGIMFRYRGPDTKNRMTIVPQKA
jgi:hypothetical protein